jgi:tyrosyl-tRNA synthetase
MLDPSTGLGASNAALLELLDTDSDLRAGEVVDHLLDLLSERRRLDLSDLDSRCQAQLIATRSVHLLPSVDELTDLLETAGAAGRRLVVKYGIDPTGADVHLGHAVPMILASRFQRMGHRVVLIVGDITAKIGDPSGRSAERPALTDADIRRNLAGYRDQISRFFDFDLADFRFNSEWLGSITLPRFVEILAGLPVSAVLQREDFRNRLSAGSGLTMAEFVYSVVMAVDSLEIEADVELGGQDQLLNMQMCRRVMENACRRPETIVATELVEGTDGTGAKMSKSRGNYVGLAFGARDVFGRLMAASDRVVPDYLRALTELLDPEIDALTTGVAEGRFHPMGLKALLASDVTAALHGRDVARQARSAFVAQFSRRRLADTPGLLVVDLAEAGARSVGAVLVDASPDIGSLGHVRRVARGGGLRLVRELGDREPESLVLDERSVSRPLASLVTESPGAVDARSFLKCGRTVVEVAASPAPG